MRRPISRSVRGAVAAVAVLAALAACSDDGSLDDENNADPGSSETADGGEPIEEAPEGTGEWFVQADYDEQDAQRSATFEGDPATPWLQYIDGAITDTSAFSTQESQKVCFANASISNPWRQTGFITMQQQLEVLVESKVISEMEVRDAQDDDNTQIADIDYLSLIHI